MTSGSDDQLVVRQRASRKLPVAGDLFAVALSGGWYLFGRVVVAGADGGFGGPMSARAF